jgi:hypothetical protein
MAETLVFPDPHNGRINTVFYWMYLWAHITKHWPERQSYWIKFVGFTTYTCMSCLVSNATYSQTSRIRENYFKFDPSKVCPVTYLTGFTQVYEKFQSDFGRHQVSHSYLELYSQIKIKTNGVSTKKLYILDDVYLKIHFMSSDKTQAVISGCYKQSPAYFCSFFFAAIMMSYGIHYIILRQSSSEYFRSLSLHGIWY